MRFTLTAEQFKAVKGLCDDYRLNISEVAKSGVLGVLNSSSYNDEAEYMSCYLYEANEDRDTGKHSQFESWKKRINSAN